MPPDAVGITPDRMDLIDNASIVEFKVVGNYLVSVTRGGVETNAVSFQHVTRSVRIITHPNGITEEIPVFEWYLPFMPHNKSPNSTNPPTGAAYGLSWTILPQWTTTAEGSDPFEAWVAHASASTAQVTRYSRSTVEGTPNSSNLNLSGTPGVIRSISASPSYIALGHEGAPYFTVYSRPNSYSITPLADTSTPPPGLVYGVAMKSTEDGIFIATCYAAGSGISIYKIYPGDVVTKLSDPSVLPPAGNKLGVSWSPDGLYLVVTHANSPYITIYKRSGDVFTKIPDPAVLPTGTGQKSAWNYDGTSLAVTHVSTPFVTIYNRSGDTFTKIANPDVLPTSAGTGVAWYPDGSYLAVGHNSSPYLTMYKRTGDVLTKLPNPTTLPASGGNDVDWSPDGQMLMVAHATTPFVSIYYSFEHVYGGTPKVIPVY